MMGKSGPYGYDPFAPGMAWDPHAAQTNLHTSCKNLVDSWLHQCAARSEPDSLSAMAALQLGEGHADPAPAAAAPNGILDMARKWRKDEAVAATPLLDAPAKGPWPFGNFGPTKKYHEPKPLPQAETCRRLLDEFVYKCDFALM